MDGRRLAGAVAGGLAAGLGISALLLLGERRQHTPSELVQLERAATARLGQEVPRPGTLPSSREQAIVHGGHLALSAAAAAVYALATDDDADAVPSGILFGLGFYGVAHWLVGPLLKVKQPEWRAGAGTIGLHAGNHLLFGLVTAGAARLARRRKSAAPAR